MSTRHTAPGPTAGRRGRPAGAWLVAAVSLLVVSGTATPCHGQRADQPPTGELAGESYVASHPLAVAGEESVHLLRGDDGLTVTIHPSYRRRITSLHLELVSDTGLHDRLDFELWLNGRPIAGWQPLAGTDPTTIHLQLPQVFLVDGPNRLVVRSPSATLQAGTSRLVVRGYWRLLTPHLSMLGDIFDDKMARQESIDIHAPGMARPANLPAVPAELLRAVSIAMQGAALRMGDRMPSIRFVHAPQPGHDVLMIGTSQDLLPHLSAEELNRITGPRLFLRPDPHSAHRIQLFITGRDDSEVRYAAMGFGLIYTALPDAPGAIIRDLNLPAEPVFVRRAAMLPGQELTLQQLGMQHDGLTLDPGAPAEWTLWLSPRAFATVQPALNADFKVIAATRLDEPPSAVAGTLAIDINQRHSVSIDFDSNSGASLEIPLTALEAGRNRFQFRWRPAADGSTPHRAVRLSAGSILTSPGQDGDLPSPGLEWLSRAAWPLVGEPDGSSFAVALIDRDPAVVQAALLMMAKLAQVANTLLYETRFHYGIPANPEHVLIFTRLDTTPAEVIDALPAELARLFGPDPVIDLPADTRLSGRHQTDDGATIGPITSIGENDWLLIAARPADRGEQSWTLAGVRNPWEAEASMAELLETDTWQQIEGDLALVAPRQPVQAWTLPDSPFRPAGTASPVADGPAPTGAVDEATGEFRDPYLKLPLAGWISTAFWLAAIPVVLTFLTITAMSMLNRNPEL